MDRLGANDQPEAKAPAATAMSPLNFVAPTEFVELPSKGMGYAEDHPLFGKDVIEIKYISQLIIHLHIDPLRRSLRFYSTITGTTFKSI